MKFLYLLFTVVFYSVAATADGLKVSAFSISPKDLSARTEPRLDNTGRNCALVKVQCPVDRLSFDGNVRGEVKYENSVYWVYMDSDSEFLLVKMSNGDPLLITFSEHLGSAKLESNTTYNLQIIIDRYGYKKIYSPRVDGSANGHDYVDLGLSVYWATCNIGAQNPNGKGERMAWGETSTKRSFSLENYKFYSGPDDEYNNYIVGDIEEGKILKSSDDAASIRWGGNWRMPNNNELIELYNNCTFYWTTYDGRSGYVVTGPNGNSIFLPFVETEEEVEIYERTYGHEVYGDDLKKLNVIRKAKVAKYASSFSSIFPGCGPSVLILRFTDQESSEYKNLTDYQDRDAELRVGIGYIYSGYSIRAVLPKTK